MYAKELIDCDQITGCNVAEAEVLTKSASMGSLWVSCLKAGV